MTIPREPDDGSIVGWWVPVRTVWVRIDEYADTDPGNLGERWFSAEEESDDGPMTWEKLYRLQLDMHRDEPYLLERRELS